MVQGRRLTVGDRVWEDGRLTLCAMLGAFAATCTVYTVVSVKLHSLRGSQGSSRRPLSQLFSSSASSTHKVYSNTIITKLLFSVIVAEEAR